ncbi:hypothetical protein [Paraburkholderia phenoliruptrix]|uniref:hypothetical protein n=1 Tax=Paraburkholderia phenoliruptrix TaxID=252970 RepID=UPI0034CD7742
MKQNIQARSGNRVVITYDGNTIGAMKSVRMNDDYAPEGVSGIGDIHMIEYVPTVARHTLTCQQVVLKKSSMRMAGIAFENGDAALQGLVFDVEVFDKDDGTLLKKYMGVSYASGDVEISANAIVISSGQFNALDTAGTSI